MSGPHRAAAPNAARLYICHAAQDSSALAQLESQLAPLLRDGLIEVWHEQQLTAGNNPAEVMRDQLARADWILPLISPDLLASDACHATLTQALRQKKDGKSQVLPIVIRPADWRDSPFGGLACLPRDGRPVTAWPNQDEAWLEILVGIRQLLTGSPGLDRDDQDSFFERVLRLCSLREEARGRRVELRRRPAAAPLGRYAEVSFIEDGWARVYDLAATEQALSLELVECFCAGVQLRYLHAGAGAVSTLVFGGPPPGEEVRRAAYQGRIRLVSFSEYQGLIDFRTYLADQRARLSADPQYPQRLYVPQRLRYQLGREEKEVEDAAPTLLDWLASPHGRFVLLLGDFGTGKTFLLHEVARRLGEEGVLVPVLVELRHLEKAHSLDALLAQHFMLSGLDRFDRPAFRHMLADGRIALLIDGFDELALRVSYSRAVEHFDTLLQATTGQAKVVVTSRTQHFQSDQQIRTTLSERLDALPGHRIAQLLPFDRSQISRFLVNQLGDTEQAEARLRLLEEVRDLLGLSANPRMLSFITAIAEPALREARARDGEITAATLYRSLLEQWLVQEHQRAHPPGAGAGLSLEERWSAVTALALHLWQRGERAIGVGELPAEVSVAMVDLAERHLDTEVAAHQVGSGTLLCRDGEGRFSFIHQSVLEWLVARAAATELVSPSTSELLARREISTLMADFLAALAGRERAETWARQTIKNESGDVAKRNALLVLARLGVRLAERVNLANASLIGQDLSGRELRGANLRGADLTEARLLGATLAEADLTNACLVRADLRDADLRKADLQGTDLSSANLMGAKMQGAQVSATTRLRATRLVGAQVDITTLHAADLHGAALPTGVELRPYLPARLAPVHAVAYSADGGLLASGGGDGTLVLYETGAFRPLCQFRGQSHDVLCLAFHPSGTLLASGTTGRSLRIWNVTSGQCAKVLGGHTGAVTAVAFAPGGDLLASASEDGSVRLWNTQTWETRHVLRARGEKAFAVSFSPDGQQVASASFEAVRLWSVATGEQLGVLLGHDEYVTCVAFSPDGQLLASGSADGTVRLWETRTGRQLSIIHQSTNGVYCLAFDPSGELLACGNETRAYLYRVKNGAVRHALKGDKHAVRALSFGPDGSQLTTGSTDRYIRIWDVAQGTLLRTLGEYVPPIHGVAFDGSGSLVSVGPVGSHQWDVVQGTLRRQLGPESPVLASSGDGQRLAIRSHEDIAILSTRTGRILRHIPGGGVLALSESGRLLAFATGDKIYVCDTRSGAVKQTMKGSQGAITALSFHPDEKLLLAASRNTDVRLWNVETGQRVGQLQVSPGYVSCAVFAPNGFRFATAGVDSTVQTWSLDNYRQHTYGGHTGLIRAVAYSKDERLLASASDDQTIRVFETATQSLLHVLHGHCGPVRSVSFSEAGTLASGGEDGTIRLWGLAKGTQLLTLRPCGEGWVAFTPDGRYQSAGDIAGQFWFTMGLCRFEPGEVDSILPIRCANEEPLLVT